MSRRTTATAVPPTSPSACGAPAGAPAVRSPSATLSTGTSRTTPASVSVLGLRCRLRRATDTRKRELLPPSLHVSAVSASSDEKCLFGLELPASFKRNLKILSSVSLSLSKKNTLLRIVHKICWRVSLWMISSTLKVYALYFWLNLVVITPCRCWMLRQLRRHIHASREVLALI